MVRAGNVQRHRRIRAPVPGTKTDDGPAGTNLTDTSGKRKSRSISNADMPRLFLPPGILLAIEGVMLTVTCTSEVVSEIASMIKKGFTDFSFCSSNTWIALLSILALLCIFISICLLTHVISATIDPKKFAKNNPNLVTNSMLHFVTVGLRSYEKFRSEEQDDKQKINDIRSQVYMNSIICTRISMKRKLRSRKTPSRDPSSRLLLWNSQALARDAVNPLTLS